MRHGSQEVQRKQATNTVGLHREEEPSHLSRRVQGRVWGVPAISCKVGTEGGRENLETSVRFDMLNRHLSPLPQA